MTDDIADCRLVEIAAAIRAGEVSSIACTRACLDRIERLQPSTNAFIRIDTEEALAAATRADEAVTRGGELGPLHGVPLAHKDLLYRAGRVSTGGSKILRDRVAPVTATAAERLDRAGAVDLGTLNMVEFAAGGTGHNEHYGDCRNPWDTERATPAAADRLTGPRTRVEYRVPCQCPRCRRRQDTGRVHSPHQVPAPRPSIRRARHRPDADCFG